MTERETMIKTKAIKALESVAGYRYNPAALEAAVLSGVPEGAVIMHRDGLVVTREGNNAVGRDAHGAVVKTIPLDGAFADDAAIMYAITMARK